ncbi:MAG: PEP-CTERM sorting domain-containing protein [bacterium]|nr:PEP-CTERM sorting domain-containing protein [bacterium]
MRRTTFILIATLIIVVAPGVRAGVVTGPINDLFESSGRFFWGDGINDLYQEWSTANPHSSGWFYASNYSGSNADIYVYTGLTDPTTVIDATLFSYTTSGAVRASEGDTVFFRGTNGYYGAWRLDDFSQSYLDAQWYFQDDGSGNFIPEPGTLGLLLLGSLVVWKRRS